METRRNLAIEALMEAAKLRSEKGISATEPVNVFDFATDTMEITVRFVDYPSMEATYLRKKGCQPTILISSLRPSGRQMFNCAHELGHHIFGHGTKIDEYIADSNRIRNTDTEEFLANSFASFFLMPKTLVSHAFYIRGWEPQKCSPEQVYIIAGWLGVGYSTLVYHMRDSLHLVNGHKGGELLRVRPKELRAQFLGQLGRENLIVVDSYWKDRAIDIEIGDFILLPPNMHFEGTSVHLVQQNSGMTLYQGHLPGRSRFFNPINEWASYSRVSKRDFVGLSRYRYLEDPDYEHN